MQFKVPQDVLRADKIVGFLTLRQLIICSLGGGLAYSLYIVLSKQYFVEIWLPPVLFITLITCAFAFFKFHDIPFEKLVLIFIEYKFRPRARTWQKMQGDAVLSVLSAMKKEEKKEAAEELNARDRRRKLEEISKVVDTTSSKIATHKKFQTPSSSLPPGSFAPKS